MKFNYLLLMVVFTISSATIKAQLPNGTTAPDFTTTDIFGQTHNLYSYLDQGYTVILKFTATWCGPCWNYHQTGALETVWDNYGPDGTDEAIVLFLESDPSTGINCLYGESSCPSSQGNWVDGTPFPIINDHIPAQSYAINFYPTIYGICPDKKVTLIGQAPAASINTFIQNCKIVNYQPTVTHVSCKGESDGAINLTIESGTEPITFLWNNGATTSSLSDLSAGVYTVTMTDAFGNITEGNPIEVLEPAEDLSASVIDITPDNCFGNNGAITVSGLGGTAPYSYVWSNGANSPSTEGLLPGTYNVTVTDVNNCITDIQSIEVGHVPPPEAFVTGETIIDCNNTFTEFDGSTSSVGPQYTYEWTTDFGNIISGQNTTNVVVDAAGTYTLFVTDNDWNCTTSASISAIEANDPPNIFTDEIAYIPCEESQMVLNSSGDSGAGYIIQWSTNDGQIIQGENSLEPLIEGEGTYTLSILNEFTGCEAISSVFVAFANPPELNSSINHIECFGDMSGNIFLDIFSVSPPFNIEWSNGHDEDVLLNVGAGTYDVTVTDNLNCVNSASFTIDQPDELLASASIIHASGEGISDGSVLINVEGGSEPYEIEWSNGETTFGLEDITPGSYSYTITDNNGCAIQGIATVQASGCSIALEVDIQQHVTCPEGTDGVVEISSPNAQGAIVVEWNDGVIGSIRDDLSAGTYNVMVIDEDGCPGQTTVEVNEPPSLNIDIESLTAFDCSEDQTGEIAISISGGTGSNYEVEWSTGDTGIALGNLLFGDITATITDEANCVYTFDANIPVDNYQLPTALSLDTLEVVLDEEGIFDLDASTIDAGSFSACDNGFDLLSLSISQSEFTCDDAGFQQVMLIATDPTGQADTTFTVLHIIDNTPPVIICPNSFETVSCRQIISYDEVLASDNCEVTIQQVSGPLPNEDFSFGQNELSFEAIDASGNVSTCSFTVNLIEDRIDVEKNVINCSCFGQNDGHIDLMIDKGAADNVEVLWSNGVVSESLEDLEAGIYVFEIISSNDCRLLDSVEVLQPDSLRFSFVRVNQDNGSSSGEIELHIVGGTEPYHVVAEGQNFVTESDSNVLLNLPADVYEIRVTDANDCQAERASVEIQLQVSYEDIMTAHNILISPNPASDFVNISIDNIKDNTFEILIVDIYGRVLKNQNVNTLSTGDHQDIRINVRDLKSGLYQIMVRSGQNHFTSGLIIQH